MKNASKYKEHRSKKAKLPKSPKSRAKNKQDDILGHNSEHGKLAHTFPNLDISSGDEQHGCIMCDHALTPQASIDAHKEVFTSVASPSSIVSGNSEVSELSPLSTPQIPEIDIALGLIISNIDIPNATIYDTALQHKNKLH